MHEKSKWPVIGSICHPLFTLINILLLASLQTSQECEADKPDQECVTSTTYFAAFGLANAFLGLIYISPGTQVILSLGRHIPAALGRNNPELIGIKAN